jgi:hypothetical protein
MNVPTIRRFNLNNIHIIVLGKKKGRVVSNSHALPPTFDQRFTLSRRSMFVRWHKLYSLIIRSIKSTLTELFLTFPFSIAARKHKSEVVLKSQLKFCKFFFSNWNFAGILKCALDIRAKWSGLYCVWLPFLFRKVCLIVLVICTSVNKR